MKTRINLESFNALSFAVVPVACPAAGQDGVGSNPIGHVVPHSLEEWFTSRGALEICGMATGGSTHVPEPALLGPPLAGVTRCPSRQQRRSRPFAGKVWPSLEGMVYESAGSGR